MTQLTIEILREQKNEFIILSDDKRFVSELELWFIAPMKDPDEGFLLDRGTWNGDAYQLKIGPDETCLQKQKDGSWIRIGRFLRKSQESPAGGRGGEAYG